MNQNEPILTVSEAAASLNLSKSKVYLMAQRNPFPHLKMGKSVRIRQCDLQEWIENNLVGSSLSLNERP